MKKIIISLIMIVGFSQFNFAQNGHGWTKQEKQNVAIVKEFLNGYFFSDENKVMPLLDPSFIQNFNGKILKYADIKTMMESRSTGEQRYESTFENITASGDEVAFRIKDHRMIGTSVKWEGLALFVVKNGKIVEEHAYFINIESN